MKRIDERTSAALRAAIQSIETCSCAEVVVEVRARSGSYSHADARFAAIVAFAVLLVVLFSRWTFSPLWAPIDVATAYGAGLLISMNSNAVRRLMTTRRDRERKVHTNAGAAFMDHGIGNTQRETGVLLYLSLLERRIDLIADHGVLDAVPVLEWNQLLETTRMRRATLATLLEVIKQLEPMLSRHLPPRADDRDELPNELRFVTE